ncbi:MAG: BsuBI/PstI family type II restriction endonuclease [Stenotrophobium sp.]
MDKKVQEAVRILKEVGMPRAQQNDRSALCLLALTGMTPGKTWIKAIAPLIGITPIMEFAGKHYMDKPYAPNTRETIRRQSMHQFCEAGIAVYNPDQPARPVNSPNAVYQISPEALSLVRAFGTPKWNKALAKFRGQRPGLAAKYAQARDMQKIPLRIGGGKTVNLSPGAHSVLIQQIVEVFGPRYAPGGKLIYAGDTGDKWGYFNEPALSALGVTVDSHGKMPDVVIHYTEKNWLLLIESVTSHGPVDGKRHSELKTLFAASTVGLVYVTAFPDRAVMGRYLGEIAWETEVWCADNPTHLIHFNGERFLGPY